MRNQAPNLIAGGNVSVSTFVKLSATHDNTGLQCGANGAVIGISQVGPRDAPGLGGTSYAATAGDNLEIFGLGDICLLLAGTGGFTRGDHLESDANGAGVTSGTGSARKIGAIALESAAAGEYGRVQVVIYDKDANSTGDSALTLTTALTFDLSGGASGDGKILLTDNLADALSVKEATNSYLTFTTTNGGETIKVHKTLTFDGTTGANLVKMPDNLADALSFAEGSNEYLTFITSNSAEAIALKKAVTAASSVLSTSATAGIGYGTGAGSTVSQATDRTTGVTINAVTGTITTQATSLAAAAEVTFTVTNSAVAATDVIVLSIKSGGTTPGSTIVAVTAVGTGSFAITLTNLHASTADTAALVISFAVIKGVAA